MIKPLDALVKVAVPVLFTANLIVSPFADTTHVVVDGFSDGIKNGTDFHEAIYDAEKNALENAVGVEIDSRAVVRFNVLTEDVIKKHVKAKVKRRNVKDLGYGGDGKGWPSNIHKVEWDGYVIHGDDGAEKEFIYITNLIKKGELVKAVNESDNFTRNHSKSNLLDDVRYLAANCWLNRTDSEIIRLDAAEDILTILESYHRGSDYIIKLKSGLGDAYFKSGEALFKDEIFNVAKDRFEKAVALGFKLNKSNQFVLVGNTYFYLSNLDKAIDFYDKALNVDPNDINAIRAKGSACLYKGNKEKAHELWNRAVSLGDQKAQEYLDKY